MKQFVKHGSFNVPGGCCPVNKNVDYPIPCNRALGSRRKVWSNAANGITYDIPYFVGPQPRPRKSLLHRLLDLLGRHMK